MNSLSTLIEPWVESSDPDERSPIRRLSRSGNSSGQSELAINETARACEMSQLNPNVTCILECAYAGQPDFAIGVRKATKETLSDLGLDLEDRPDQIARCPDM